MKAFGCADCGRTIGPSSVHVMTGDGGQVICARCHRHRCGQPAAACACTIHASRAWTARALTEGEPHR